MAERLKLDESEDWFEVLDSDDYIVAQFTSYADAVWFINNRDEGRDD